MQLGQSRRNFLGRGANFHAMHVPGAAAVEDEMDAAGGNGEAQTFAASALRENESVDAQHRAVHIDQRSPLGFMGRLGLQVGERLGRGWGERTDYAHGDGILQTFRTADGETPGAQRGGVAG